MSAVKATHRPTHISCHVLDTALGIPASGVRAVLSQLASNPESLSSDDDPEQEPQWRVVDRQDTDADGRARFQLPAPQISSGLYLDADTDTGTGTGTATGGDGDGNTNAKSTVYRVSFYTAAHHASSRADTCTSGAGASSGARPSAGRGAFFPRIDIQFDAAATAPAIDPQTGVLVHRFHIPLLLSPFGYSTYRGS